MKKLTRKGEKEMKKAALFLAFLMICSGFSACSKGGNGEFSSESNAGGGTSFSSGSIENDSGTNEEESSSETEEKRNVLLTAYAGTSVDICNETIRTYIDNMSNYDILAGMLKEEEANAEFYTKQNISFSWTVAETAAPYTVFFADNADFDNAFEVQTSECMLSDVGIFVPGQTYYWKVMDDRGEESEIDTFTVQDKPVRFITADGMWNVRDGGGWETESGQRVKYGMLYRGDQPTNASNAGKKVLEYLGINGEIDLRLNSSLTQNAFNASASFLNAGIKYFSQIIPGEYDYSTEQTDNIGKAFKFLADESNYPVYYHCTFGKDRTGTMALLINGLLGVKYDQMMCDYELSSYGKGIGSQPRNTIVSNGNGGYAFTAAKDDPWGAVGRLYYVLRRNYATSDSQPFSEVVATYLKRECGVTDADIASFRSIMLENVD